MRSEKNDEMKTKTRIGRKNGKGKTSEKSKSWRMRELWRMWREATSQTYFISF